MDIVALELYSNLLFSMDKVSRYGDIDITKQDDHEDEQIC